MDFTLSDRSRELQERLAAFMDECVYPAEAVYARSRETSLDPHRIPPVVENLKVEARSRGLWNLFLPGLSGLSNTDYAPLAELMGRSPTLAAEACNCSAPDTGNLRKDSPGQDGPRNHGAAALAGLRPRRQKTRPADRAGQHRGRTRLGFSKVMTRDDPGDQGRRPQHAGRSAGAIQWPRGLRS